MEKYPERRTAPGTCRGTVATRSHGDRSGLEGGTGCAYRPRPACSGIDDQKLTAIPVTKALPSTSPCSPEMNELFDETPGASV